jgi:hypothetical protein
MPPRSPSVLHWLPRARTLSIHQACEVSQAGSCGSSLPNGRAKERSVQCHDIVAVFHRATARTGQPSTMMLVSYLGRSAAAAHDRRSVLVGGATLLHRVAAATAHTTSGSGTTCWTAADEAQPSSFHHTDGRSQHTPTVATVNRRPNSKIRARHCTRRDHGITP